MFRNEEIKRKNIFSKTSFLAIVLFFIGILISCNSKGPEEPESATAKIVGKISDESISDIQDISVRLIRMELSEKDDTVSIKDAITDSHGKFVLETDLDGVRNLVAKAEKDDMELRGVVSSEVRTGIAVYMQPLNLVTTEASDLYMSALISNNSLEYTQIAILIDKDIAATIDSNSQLIDDVAAAFEKGSGAEKEILLRPEIGGTTSQYEQIMNAKIVAQSALDRDLYYAGSESAKQVAFQSYLNSVADAYVDAGMQSVTFSKVLEASNRVFLKEIERISPRLNFEFIKRSSEIRARIINIAVQITFQELGADPSTINKIINSGEDLENGIINLHSAKEISDEFSSYKDELINYLERAIGVNGNVIPAVEDSITLYKNDLISGVDNGSEQSAIIEAYINFYENIINLVNQQTGIENINQNAVADILILLNIYY